MKTHPEHKDMHDFKAEWPLVISWMKSYFLSMEQILEGLRSKTAIIFNLVVSRL